MGRPARKKPEQPQQTTKEKLKSIKKERKQKLKEKRARLIIRNLPFQVTPEDLRTHFEKFGELEDVKVLKKEDGALVGCGFVQYKLVQKAAKARHHLNGKSFFDREITVDFALPKDKFEKNAEMKQEEQVKIKEEPIDEIEDVKTELTDDEKADNDNEEPENESEEESGVESIEADGEEESANDDDEEDEEEDSVEGEETKEIESEPIEKKPRFESNDVVEGRTVFIKNLPFSATNDDLKECMQQFGPIYYALICMDKYTEHSKGTAFVKFREVEDAEKALSAGTELTLQGNVLDCHKALPRNQLQQKSIDKKEEKTTKKDSRNLYLVKEGVILAGSKAAQSVSASDMAKRLQLEQYKTQMLRNLNMFVASERIVVHNLPSSWDDKKFRSLIQNNSPKNAVIREARVMRDLKNVDESGVGRSKEFGFVTLVRHEDALATLRALNNNPNIFSANRRPIVAFSIENKTMIKAKQKRLEKSRLKNPKAKSFDPNVVKADEEKRQKRLKLESSESEKDFVGVTAKPGVVNKMRSRYNLKTQAKLHHENLKKEKKKSKFAKKSLKERKQDFTKQPKQKVNKKKKTTDDNFAKLVSDYKRKLQTPPEAKKTKWYA